MTQVVHAPPSEPTAVASDEAAVEELFARMYPQLTGVLARYRVRPEDAQDLLQEVFTCYIERSGVIANPGGWLTRALRNKCVDFIRTERRRLYVALDTALLAELAGSTDEDPIRSVLVNEVKAVARRLSALCQRVLSLRYRLDLNRREAARALGRGDRGVASTERRCLEALAARLGLGARRLDARWTGFRPDVELP